MWMLFAVIAAIAAAVFFLDFGASKTLVPATRTSAPASMSRRTLPVDTPPSISMWMGRSPTSALTFRTLSTTEAMKA